MSQFSVPCKIQCADEYPYFSKHVTKSLSIVVLTNTLRPLCYSGSSPVDPNTDFSTTDTFKYFFRISFKRFPYVYSFYSVLTHVILMHPLVVLRYAPAAGTSHNAHYLPCTLYSHLSL